VRALRTAFAAGLLVSGVALAQAQPRVPANELPGRERERFIESPLERFLKPGPFDRPQVIEEPRYPRKGTKRGAKPKPKRKPKPN
jgi:hypothetical protein